MIKSIVTKYFQAPSEILIKKKMREGLTKEEVWKDLIKNHVHLQIVKEKQNNEILMLNHNMKVNRHQCYFQIGEYRSTFNRFDADGNGSIDAEELGKLIRVLG